MHPILGNVLGDGYALLSGVTEQTLTFAESLGEVFRPLQDECPIVNMKIEGNDPLQTPYASCRTPALSLHTDYATFPEPPRFTITHCIEPDPNYPQSGISVVLLLEPAIARIQKHDPSLLALLQQEVFPFRRNAEHGLYHSETPTFAILDLPGRVRFDSTLITPHLERSECANRLQLIEAVHEFEKICEEHAKRIEVPLDRHGVLIIDNRRVLHSRSACTVRWEGSRLVSREVNLAFLV